MSESIEISAGTRGCSDTKSNPPSTKTEDADVLELSKNLENITMAGPAFKFVGTQSDIIELAATLMGLPNYLPSLYMDLEGINLSRHGAISILQIFVLPENKTYLVDIHSLGHEAFLLSEASNKNLKEILESPDIHKVFFDVRNDSDALYSLFQVKLAGVQDLQLMELATRTFSRRYVNGLARCIEKSAVMSPRETFDWKHAKDKGLNLFDPAQGGSYEIFNIRPLPEDMIQYCLQDVHILPKLWQNYNQKLTPRWRQKIDKAVEDRLELSRSSSYNGKGKHIALAPKGWA